MGRVVNGSVPIRVHSRPGTETVKEKLEPDPDPEPFQNMFFYSATEIGTRTGTLYGTGLDPGPDLGRK